MKRDTVNVGYTLAQPGSSGSVCVDMGYRDLGKPAVSVIDGSCVLPPCSLRRQSSHTPIRPPEHFKLFRFREPRLILTVNYLTFGGATMLYLDFSLASTPTLVSR